LICNIEISSATINKKSRPNQDNLIIDKYVSCVSGLSSFSSVFISDTSEIRLFAVADGVGGEASGDVASDIVVRTFSEYLDTLKESGKCIENLKLVLDKANEAVCKKFDGFQLGASTLSGILIDKNCAYAFNVGDSPMYYLHNSVLKRIDTAHTMSAPMERKIGEAENTLTRYMGNRNMSGSEQASFSEIPLSEGDIFLICTDGVEKGLSEKTISKLLMKKSANTAETIVSKAYSATLREKRPDDTTAIAIKIYV